MSETANALNEFKKRRDEARRSYAKALRIISNVDMELLNIQDLDTQKARVDGLSGEAGSVHQLVQLLNSKLDALSTVKSPNGMSPEEIMPQTDSSQMNTEVGVGGEPNNMVEAPISAE
jgi:hypothetical protein